MDHRRTETFYAITAPGLEPACAAELNALGMPPDVIEKGGVVFHGQLRDLYQANLWLRTASRVLVRFAKLSSRDFPDLFRKACRLPWGRFIKPGTAVAFRATSRKSRLVHSKRIADTLEAATNKALGRRNNPKSTFQQLVHVRVVNDRLTLSIDSSGPLLHRRGYRLKGSKASLRETLAAGTLMLLGWSGDRPLADPMCGSASFLLEAALIARHQAPGLNRQFAFMQWPGYREGVWRLLCEEASRAQLDSPLILHGADQDQDAVASARANCACSGLNEMIDIELRSLADQPMHQNHGLLVSNPPYGKRLSLNSDPLGYYQDIGKQIGRAYPNWDVALLCPSPDLVRATGLPFKRLTTLDNGGLRVGLFRAQLS